MRSKIVPKEEIPELPKDNCITYEEDLPYPYVHYPDLYGSFFSFQETETGPLFHCSCQKKGIEVYLQTVPRFYYMSGAASRSIVQDLIQKLHFRDNLCHICNKISPHYGFGKGHDSTKFHSIYGYYIKGLMLEYGIGATGNILVPAHIPSDIVPYLITSRWDDHKLDEESLRDFTRYCEDIIRIRTGYFAIGKKWTTEIKLLQIIKKLYPKFTVTHQYPIDHLRADIFIEELQLVIEYHGKQHFEAIDFFGGEEALQRTRARDEEKVHLCNYYDIGIVYFNYKEDLTEGFVKQRIKEYLRSKEVMQVNEETIK